MESAQVLPEPELELEFRAAQSHLNDTPSSSGGLMLIVSLALFLLVQTGTGNSLENIALLVGALLIHEGGHFVGMRLFGFRDVKMFFVPFFGAAVSGKRGGVATWKESLVLLLGPMPGIFLGIAFMIIAWISGEPLWRDAASMFVLLNAFNLLPFGGLDGGKLFQRLLFCRNRHLEIAFLAIGGAVLMLLAIKTHSWFLAIFAYVGLATIPFRRRLLHAASTLRSGPLIALDTTSLDDASAQRVFVAAREALNAKLPPKPKLVATVMEDLVESLRPAPSFGATLLLLFIWFVGVLLALIAFIAFALSTAQKWETTRDDKGHYSIEFPAKPSPQFERRETYAGSRLAHIRTARREFTKRYTVEWIEEATDSLDARRDALAREFGARVTKDQSIALEGHTGRELELTTSSRVYRVRLFVANGREYEIFTSAPPGGDADANRVLDSFHVLP